MVVGRPKKNIPLNQYLQQIESVSSFDHRFDPDLAVTLRVITIRYKDTLTPRHPSP